MKLGMVAWALLLSDPSHAAPSTDEASTVRYLQAVGHQIAADPAPADLAPIVTRLSGARVIGLGEVTHGTHEDVAFKATLVRELVRVGAIDTLAIEANRIVGVTFDRYLRQGIGDPAALIMSPSSFKIFKNDEFAGLLLWLRAWNIAHPGRQVGAIAIDDQDGSVDADFALTVLSRHDAALAGTLRTKFGTIIPIGGAQRVRPSDWIAAHDANDVERVLAASVELLDAFAKPAAGLKEDADFAEANYAARLAWQNLRVFELDVKGSSAKGRAPEYWSRRDRFMAENLVDRLDARRRAVLWAHNGHVLHTYPARWTEQGYTGLGVEVRRRLGMAYRTLGFTYTRATVIAVRGKDIDLKQLVAEQHDEPIVLDNSGPNTTGGVMARVPGDAWWFDTARPITAPDARRWLGQPVWGGSVGWIVDPLKFQKSNVAEDSTPPMMGFDVLVWYRTMTPQHRWPAASTVQR